MLEDEIRKLKIHLGEVKSRHDIDGKALMKYRRLYDEAQNKVEELEKELTAYRALEPIVQERKRQDDKWGPQNHLNGTSKTYKIEADNAKEETDKAAREERLTWRHILTEEFWEAMAEEDVPKLEVELVQIQAVAQAWIEALKRRELLK